jgi:hypothetical protein
MNLAKKIFPKKQFNIRTKRKNGEEMFSVLTMTVYKEKFKFCPCKYEEILLEKFSLLRNIEVIGSAIISEIKIREDIRFHIWFY